MLEADRIVFMYPVYWFSVPGHAKLYIDQVFTPGFAYTIGANPPYAQLHNKTFHSIMTVGANKIDYPEERVLSDMGSEIAMYTGMKCERAFVFYDDDNDEKV
jgi:putative NADPH-quinone reductase